MFLSGAHGSPVYEFLGKKGLGTDEFPPLGTPLVDGEVAFRQHAGGHSTDQTGAPGLPGLVAIGADANKY